MPWQAHLFIGEPIATYEQAAAILIKLGADPAQVEAKKDELDYHAPEDLGTPKRSITYRGVVHEVAPAVFVEGEAGDSFPEQDPKAMNTFAMVCFPLTTRYSPEILDVGNPHGRPDPFIIDMDGVADILRQVREWWPEAQFMVCDVFH